MMSSITIKETIIKEDLGPFRVNWKSVLQIASNTSKEIGDTRFAYTNDITQAGFLRPLDNDSAFFIVESKQYFKGLEHQWVQFETPYDYIDEDKINFNSIEDYDKREREFNREMDRIDNWISLVEEIDEGTVYMPIVDATGEVPRLDKNLICTTHADRYNFYYLASKTYNDSKRFSYDTSGRLKWKNFNDKATHNGGYVQYFWAKYPKFKYEKKIKAVK